MIKKSAFKRIALGTLSLLIIGIIYSFPTKDKDKEDNISYIDSVKTPIFLVDKNNYVSRIQVINQGATTEQKVRNIISSLTIGNSNSIYIPSGFSAIIPEKTKILELNIKDSIIKINFSKELLNIDADKAEKMIESIVYSLTEIKDINGVMIFVEGKRLLKLPNSTTILPLVLDRDIGINKTYDISSLKNVTKLTTYYVAKSEDIPYYIPVTSINNDIDDKIKIIIKNLKSSPIDQTNLSSFLAAEATLSNYEILENSINLSFNNNLIANMNDKEILEEVRYSIFLSLKDSYSIKSVIFETPNAPISIVN